MSGSKNRHSGLIRGDDEDEAVKAYVPTRWRQSARAFVGKVTGIPGPPFETRPRKILLFGSSA
jgi:hypothetical protein